MTREIEDTRDSKLHLILRVRIRGLLVLRIRLNWIAKCSRLKKDMTKTNITLEDGLRVTDKFPSRLITHYGLEVKLYQTCNEVCELSNSIQSNPIQSMQPKRQR